LSHTPVFREYFTSKAYLNDINTTNPLGYEGRLAQVTAMLINSLWKRFNNQANDPTSHQKRVTAPGSYALVTAPALTPKTFKESLSKFNEHFQGNEQHDAQELLAFLLGGLSEDLNRIVNKPYIEAPDSDGRPDKELADIWWSNHLKREMSIIVALFTGQYKSLLTCRTCKYESARFEPFSFLQIPLPEDDNLTVSLILYPIKENSCTVKYCVRVRNDGKLRDVLIALAKVLQQDELAENMNTNPSDPVTSTAPVSDDEPNDEEYAYAGRIQNLAVVDMRDAYISKIAPVRILLILT
jgi:ubiquitin C-terminal hydrolase